MTQSTFNKIVGLGIAAVVLVIISAIVFVTLFLAKVDNGHVGVIYSMNGGVQETTLGQGFHVVGVTDKVIEYPVKTQSKNYDGLASATRDGKTLNLPVSINYHVDPEQASTVYKKFGNVAVEDLEDGYIKTRVNDALRQVVSQYTVIETLGEKTGEIKTATLERAKEDLAGAGFVVEDVVINAPQPDAETQSAIDDRVKASQELERAEIDLQKAEKEAARVKVESQGKAAANKILEESLSDSILEQQLIEKWSGQNPISIGSEGVIVDLPSGQKDE